MNLISWSNGIAATLSKSPAAVPAAMSVFSWWLCYMTSFFLLSCLLTDSKGFQPLIPSNLSLRRMYVEHWMIWYICRLWLLWVCSGTHRIVGVWMHQWGCTDAKTQHCGGDAGQMASGICITSRRKGSLVHSEIFRLPKHSVWDEGAREASRMSRALASVWGHWRQL